MFTDTANLMWLSWSHSAMTNGQKKKIVSMNAKLVEWHPSPFLWLRFWKICKQIRKHRVTGGKCPFSDNKMKAKFSDYSSESECDQLNDDSSLCSVTHPWVTTLQFILQDFSILWVLSACLTAETLHNKGKLTAFHYLIASVPWKPPKRNIQNTTKK